MKYLNITVEQLVLGEIRFKKVFIAGERLNSFLSIITLLFLVTVIGSMSIPHLCYADNSCAPVAGFLIPKERESIVEKSLIAGYSLFFKEKSSNPSQYYIKKYYGDTEESLLESLAELLKNPCVKAIVAPYDVKGTQQLVDAATVSERLIFVSHPSVRFVSGEICRPNVFRLSPNTYVSSQPLARWAFSNLGHKVFIVNEDSLVADEQADFFALGIEKIGGSFGDRYIIRKDSSGFEAILERLKEVKPDFVFAALSGETARAFLKTFRESGMMSKFPLVGVDSLTSFPQPLKTMGDDGLGIKTLSSIKDPLNLAKSLAGEMTEPVNMEMAAQGYDIANVLFSCIQKGVFSDGQNQKPYEFVSKLSLEGLRGVVRFDANGDAVIPMAVGHWESDSLGGFKRIVDEQLEPCRSIDFGCGGVGFPDRPEPLAENSNQGLWEEHQQ